jgi:hypothetical protein
MGEKGHENGHGGSSKRRCVCLTLGVVFLCLAIGASRMNLNGNSDAALGWTKSSQLKSTKKKKKSSSSSSSSKKQIVTLANTQVEKYGNRRLCRLVNVNSEDDSNSVPTLGDQPWQIDPASAPLTIRFQCAGEPYEQFGKRLDQFVSNSTRAKWGKRPLPLPRKVVTENSGSRINILILGSSQLRQIITALLCQYHELVVKTERIYGASKHSLASFGVHLTLQNKVHLYVVVNPPFLYCDMWQQLLEEHVLKMKLERMDLMVVSNFHKFTASHGQALMEFLQDHEGTRDAEQHVATTPPPTFLQIVRAYQKPIIYVSLFAKFGETTFHHVQQSIASLSLGEKPPPEPTQQKIKAIEMALLKKKAQQQPKTTSAKPISEQASQIFTTKAPPPKIGGGGAKNKNKMTTKTTKTTGYNNNNTRRQLYRFVKKKKRTNLIAIDARKYTSKLGECSTETFKTVGTCMTDPSHPRYAQGHKCMGAYGSHADLVAWDLIEAMYKVMVIRRRR